MVGARLVLGALIVAMTAAVFSPAAAADCHTSWTGCTPCPSEAPCDSDDVIGTVAGIIVSGDAEEDHDDQRMAAAAAQSQRASAGRVVLRFEWADENASNEPVPLRLMFTGNVDWPGAVENFTFDFTFTGAQERTFGYGLRSVGLHYIPFRIVAHPDTPHEETLEGVFTVGRPLLEAPWPWAVGAVALVAVAILRRR